MIVHQLTALHGPMGVRSLKRMAAAINRLRTEGTDHLLAAGRAVWSENLRWRRACHTASRVRQPARS